MYRPTGKNVLVERLPAAKESAGGIILKSSDEPDRAKVIAVGPEVDTSLEVNVDEVALVNWNAATKVQDELYIINVDNIILVFED